MKPVMNNIFSVFLFNNKHIFNATGRLLPESIFWLLLQRERFLADRGERLFAVVVFDLDSVRNDEALCHHLTEAILERLRCSDAVGWVDRRRIGALLARATAADAQRVAENICAQLPEADKPAYDIYAYPADRLIYEDPQSAGLQSFSRAAPDILAASSTVVTGAARIYALLIPPMPVWKRLFDIAGASVLLLALSPLFLLLSLYIKLVSPGPVLFRQQRIGRACQPFTCFKFRSMHTGAETRSHQAHMRALIQSGAPMTKLDAGSDHRLIPLGRMIRATGLDELPQLFNVLRGDMSLVGPRPCIDYEYQTYEDWQLRRFDTRPGLTGLWQVSGKNRTTFEQMMRLDARYARHPSVIDDLGILFRTVPAVVRQVLDMHPLRLHREAA